jgi:hypothetical protein
VSSELFTAITMRYGALQLRRSRVSVTPQRSKQPLLCTIELFGRPCRVIAIEDLIRAKDALGRPQDVLAAQELLA